MVRVTVKSRGPYAVGIRATIAVHRHGRLAVHKDTRARKKWHNAITTVKYSQYDLSIQNFILKAIV
jgi:hypothetical protein